MKLSYIIPTYNLAPEDIRRCLASLSQQDLSPADYEVIVVDDESDVSPEPVVREWEHEMTIRFFRQPHARQGAARNVGIREATGDYIRFVDGDDYLPPHTAAPLISYMEAHSLDIIIFGFRKSQKVEKSKSQKVEEPESQKDDKKPFRPLDLFDFSTFGLFPSGQAYMRFHTLFGSPCTLCFRRELLSSPPLRFAENTYIEDEEFVTRLVWRAGPMAVTPFVGYIYVQRPDSTVHHPSPEHIDELFNARFDALGGLIRLAQSEPQPHEGLDRKIRFLSIDILRHALRQDDWQRRFLTCATTLKSNGLFPLPKARYSWKYTLFRLLSPTRLGQRLLRHHEASNSQINKSSINRKP